MLSGFERIFFFYKLFLYWPSVFVRAISLTGAAYEPCGINPFFHTQKQIEVNSTLP